MKIIKKIGFMWFVTIVILFVGLYLSVFNPTDNNTLLLWGNILSNLCVFLAVISLYLTFSSLKFFDESKAAWLILLLGISLCFLGKIVYSYYEVIAQIDIPFPSLADGFRLSGYIFLCVGLLYLILGFKNAGFPIGTWREFLGIGLLLSVAFCFICLELFIPLFKNPNISDLQKFLHITYPIGDLILIFLVIILVRITSFLGSGVFFRPWRYMVIGFILMGLGDLLFSYYVWHNIYTGAGGYIDLFPNAGYLLIAMGALSQRKIIKSL